MEFGSLFSGIGGLDLAMEACGHTAAWQVEIDPFCNSILETHWPDVDRYADIREIDWSTMGRPPLICGGFPCQPFSVAGKNRGEDDERNLWPETIRAVRDLRPRYVFLENVPGLLAHGYFGRILGDLAEGGYDAVWDTFTAAEVGAPHRRERLFILAYTASERLERRRDGRAGLSTEPVGLLPRRPGELLADAAGSRQRTAIRDDDARQPDAAGSGTPMALSDHERCIPIHGSRGEPAQSGLANHGFPPGPDDLAAWARVLAEVPALEPAVCRVATGVPDRTHRLKALGNAVVPAQGALAFRVLWQRMMEKALA